MIEWDEIISVMDIVSTKMTNTTATNLSINCHTKKKKHKDCYILYIVLLAIILLLIIIVICYHYARQKGIDAPVIQNGK